MTEQEANVFVERLLPLQQRRIKMPCPRCGYDLMDSENPARNALSRRANVYVCSACGMQEALEDWTSHVRSITEWAIFKG